MSVLMTCECLFQIKLANAGLELCIQSQVAAVCLTSVLYCEAVGFV
jgi:hypothetical protein